MLSHPPTSTLFPYTTLFRSSSLHCSRLQWRNCGDQRLRRRNPPSRYPHPDRHSTWSLSGAAIPTEDRKSTRLNSSHRCISYAVFCLKKKKKTSKNKEKL